MLLYSDSLKLTREYLDVVEQLNNTPKLYFNAVAEVVRRRIFSQALLIVSSIFCEIVSNKNNPLIILKIMILISQVITFFSGPVILRVI